MTAAILTNVMDAIVACINTSLADHPDPPSIVGRRIGVEIPHDASVWGGDLCCQGLAYVALGDLYPSSSSFPEQDINRQANTACAPPTLAAQFKIGIIRCSPVGTAEQMPTEVEWAAAASTNIYDAWALWKVACCVRNWLKAESGALLGMSAVLERQNQGTPQGGCVERYFMASVQIPNCEC